MSVFAPDAAEEPQVPEQEEEEEEWQEFPWEKLLNPDEKQDENIPLQAKRRSVVRFHDKENNGEEPSHSIAAFNRAGPSGWRPAEQTPRARRLESSDFSDEEGAEATCLAEERRKRRRCNRRAARQFISSMASVEGGSISDREKEEEDASSTASDDSFVAGDDIFD